MYGYSRGVEQFIQYIGLLFHALNCKLKELWIRVGWINGYCPCKIVIPLRIQDCRNASLTSSGNKHGPIRIQS